MNQVMYATNPNGVMYPNVQKPAYSNPLGEEKIKRLLASGKGMPKINITEEDMDQAICTHRANGELMTYALPDGRYQCKICGAKFHMLDDVTTEEVKQATENLHDILHTAKVIMVSAPDKMIVDNFQILAVVDKVPEIYDIAIADYQKFISMNPQAQGYGGNNMSGQGMWNAIMGGGMQQVPMQMAYDQYGRPVYVQQQQVVAGPTMAQQVMTQGGQVSNGFVYTEPNTVNVPTEQAAAPAQTQQAAPVVNTTLKA